MQVREVYVVYTASQVCPTVYELYVVMVIPVHQAHMERFAPQRGSASSVSELDSTPKSRIERQLEELF